MGLLSRFSGKDVQDKIEDYSEMYGEILLGLHRELEKQNALLEKQEQHFNSQVENLHGQVKDIGDSLKKLEDRSEQNHLQITDEFKSFRTVIEQYRLEASTIEDIKKSLSQVVRKLDQQNKHIQLLRIMCILSYIFAIGVGVVIWMIS